MENYSKQKKEQMNLRGCRGSREKLSIIRKEFERKDKERRKCEKGKTTRRQNLNIR